MLQNKNNKTEAKKSRADHNTRKEHLQIKHGEKKTVLQVYIQVIHNISTCRRRKNTSASRVGYEKAWIPVIAFAKMRVWMSCGVI
jgi:hypothetical protein